MKNDARGAIIGSIVGDALGVPVEFESKEVRDNDPVADMREYGTYKQPKGTWSDDTSMSLCIMENIVEGYNLNPDKLLENWGKWYLDAKWTPYNDVFDIGTSTANALYKYSKQNHKWYECGNEDVHSNGNGSLMRAMPASLYLANFNDQTLMSMASIVSSTTHAHPISRFCCVYHALMVKSMINGNRLIASMNDAHEKLLPAIYLMSKSDRVELRRILEMSILDEDRDNISGSGYVVHSLEAMIWCLHNNVDFKSTVLSAVNLGDDTDTTACIVGGMAGFIYGLDDIPTEWIDCLARLDDINELTDRYLEKI